MEKLCANPDCPLDYPPEERAGAVMSSFPFVKKREREEIKFPKLGTNRRAIVLRIDSKAYRYRINKSLWSLC